MAKLRTRILGTGSYLPAQRVTNEDFKDNEFFTAERLRNPKPAEQILRKLTEISGIAERRYAAPDENTSTLGYLAAEEAIRTSGIDRETLDYIVVAHNFGDVLAKNHCTDMLPNLAARVKAQLGIQNSDCVAYDILFGCPSWVQALIQVDAFLRVGDGKRALVVGADVLSRVLDPSDIDSMLFADGAGAAVVESFETDENDGILACKAITDSVDKARFLTMGASHNPSIGEERLYVKMQGTSVFRYGIEKVPPAIAGCLRKAGVDLREVKKIIMHQANERMIRGMVKKLAEIYGLDDLPESVVPYSVNFLGNSSAATIPTLLDLVFKGQMGEHRIDKGDVVVFASVGAGMHANCVVYRHS